MEELRDARRRAVGSKETLKQLDRGMVHRVYVAEDADERVRLPVVEAALRQGVEIVTVDSMRTLGRVCGIDVGAAAAAVLREGGEAGADD